MSSRPPKRKPETKSSTQCRVNVTGLSKRIIDEYSTVPDDAGAEAQTSDDEQQHPVQSQLR